MTTQVEISFDDLAALGDRIIRGELKAARQAAAEVTREVEKALEERTREAVPGRLWRAWRSDIYPKAGISREPAGIVSINGGSRSRGALEFFTSPGRIQGRNGQWLAIPLPAAGPRGRTRNLTPGDWERQTGKRLRLVYRPGKPGLLVADMGTINARTGTFRPITRARTAADARRGFMRGEQTVPIFVLVPFVPFRNAFSIDQVVAPVAGRLGDRYAAIAAATSI